MRWGNNMFEQMFEVAVVGIVGAACIAWALVCWKKIINFDFWRD